MSAFAASNESPKINTALLAVLLSGGCTINSGVATTPTFEAARYVPPSIGTAPAKQAPAPAAWRGSPTVRPTPEAMVGAAWVIENHDPTRIYQVPTRAGRVSTILLPPGQKFNAAMGGNVEGFLINVAYAGPRPVVSILPRLGGASGNLQVATTDGIYLFDLVPRRGSIDLVDIGEREAAPATADQTPQPEGDFTRLTFKTPDGRAMPAWAPVEAWADSVKMVVRFQGPLPVMPALFAGQKGEQIVSYRTLAGPTLVTSRRVTEGELRLDQEVLRITVDGAADWRQAAELPPASAPQSQPSPVAFVFMPGPGKDVDRLEAVGQPASGQPMANHLVEPGI